MAPKKEVKKKDLPKKKSGTIRSILTPVAKTVKYVASSKVGKFLLVAGAVAGTYYLVKRNERVRRGVPVPDPWAPLRGLGELAEVDVPLPNDITPAEIAAFERIENIPSGALAEAAGNLAVNAGIGVVKAGDQVVKVLELVKPQVDSGVKYLTPVAQILGSLVARQLPEEVKEAYKDLRNAYTPAPPAPDNMAVSPRVSPKSRPVSPRPKPAQNKKKRSASVEDLNQKIGKNRRKSTT